MGKNTLHGELYLDADGHGHFICHTPGTMSFEESRDGLKTFIELLQDQLDRQKECPFHKDMPDLAYIPD